MTTAQLRQAARLAEQSLRWDEAAALLRQAIASYPRRAGRDTLAERDIALMTARAEAHERAAQLAASGDRQMTTQKARWAAKASRYTNSAARLTEAASAALSARNTDWAFASQPGHIPARAREIARTDRAMEMLAKADAMNAKAAQLSRMATTNKGDAESARQAARERLESVQPGQMVTSFLYGVREVVRVNRKTFSVRDSFGGTMTVDKAHCVPA